MVATTVVPAGVPSGAVIVVVVTTGGAPESVRVMTQTSEGVDNGSSHKGRGVTKEKVISPERCGATRDKIMSLVTPVKGDDGATKKGKKNYFQKRVRTLIFNK